MADYKRIRAEYFLIVGWQVASGTTAADAIYVNEKGANVVLNDAGTAWTYLLPDGRHDSGYRDADGAMKAADQKLRTPA